MRETKLKQILRAAVCAVAACALTVSLLPLAGCSDETVEPEATLQTSDPIAVDVQAKTIEIDVKGVGESGKANLMRYEANEYQSADPWKGLNAEKTSSGEAVGVYDCGTEQHFSIPRYTDSGKDYLYSKYYVEQNGTLLAGPYYATQVEPLSDTKVRLDVGSKKGAAFAIGTEDVNTLKDLDANWANFVLNAADYLQGNEDGQGNPIDNAGRDDLISFECNGQNYYFKKASVEKLDGLVAACSKDNMNVQLVLFGAYGDLSAWPKALRFDGVPQDMTLGYNTSSPAGRDYWVAFLEFLAQRYSKSRSAGLVHNFVIGNEIDFPFRYHLIMPDHTTDAKGVETYTRVPVDTYMEEYSRELRLANLAVKKYSSQMSVGTSFTHYWAKNFMECKGLDDTSNHYVNSFPSKELLDWLCTHEAARGNYDWCLAPHPYGYRNVHANTIGWDMIGAEEKGMLTGDFNTSPYLTTSNLEILQMYLEQEQCRFNGNVRNVYLTETGISSYKGTKGHQRAQAANIAIYYYRAACLDCVKSLEYWPVIEPQNYMDGNPNYNMGLVDRTGETKPAYKLWKKIDSHDSLKAAEKYMKYASFVRDGEEYSVKEGNIKSYKDFMTAIESDFDWDAAWDEKKFVRQEVQGGSGAPGFLRDAWHAIKGLLP